MDDLAGESVKVDVGEVEQLAAIESGFGCDVPGGDADDYMPTNEQADSVPRPEEIPIYPVLMMAGRIGGQMYGAKREAQGLEGRGFSDDVINGIAAPLAVAIEQDAPAVAQIGPWGAAAIGLMTVLAVVVNDEMDLQAINLDEKQVHGKSQASANQ